MTSERKVLLPFTPTTKRRPPTERDVLAVCYAFSEWQKARAARLADEVRLRAKPDRRSKR